MVGTGEPTLGQVLLQRRARRALMAGSSLDWDKRRLGPLKGTVQFSPAGSGSGGGGTAANVALMQGPFLEGQHPVDDVIRALIADPKRVVTADEVDQIRGQIGTAPYNQNIIKVRAKYRGIMYQGMTLGQWAPSLQAHLAIRVVYDEQWGDGTTAETYVADLHAAIQDPQAQFVVYTSGTRALLAVLASHYVAAGRLGLNTEPLMFVVYDAGQSVLITGHQTAGIQEVDIPQGARWLT